MPNTFFSTIFPKKGFKPRSGTSKDHVSIQGREFHRFRTPSLICFEVLLYFEDIAHETALKLSKVLSSVGLFRHYETHIYKFVSGHPNDI